MKSVMEKTAVTGVPVSVIAKVARTIWSWLPSWGRSQATVAPQPTIQATATNTDSNLNISSSDIATTVTSSVPQHSSIGTDLNSATSTDSEEIEESITPSMSLIDSQNQGAPNAGDGADRSTTEVNVKLNHPPVEQDPVVTISPPQQVPGAQQNIENTPSVSDRLRELEEALKQAQATIEEQKRSAERFQQETTARQQQEEERHKIEEERLRQEVEAKYKQEKEKMKKQQELIQEKLKEGFVELKNQVQNSLESDKKQREETTNQQLDTTKINKAITNKEALLEQLNSIINDSTTIILEPENCVSEYQVNAPFAKKQAFINGLRKFHTPVLGDLMLAAKDESDPFNVDVVKLAKRIGLQIEELQDLELRIEVHNLDLQNDLASRRERIIKGIHSDSASRASVDGKPKNTSSDSKGIVLTFGAKTNSNKSVVINIDPDNQDNMLQSVVARDIREYEETIHANKVGVVLTGKIPSRNTGTVYVSGITNKPTKNK